MTKYLKFLWTAYRAYQGDPEAAKEVVTTIAKKVIPSESDPANP